MGGATGHSGYATARCAMSDPKQDDDRPVTFTDWLGLTDAPRWWLARPLGIAVSVVMLLLFVLALSAAVVVLARSFTAAEAGLGTGGLIVALLGAPFLIWSTVLKHQTLRYQKEGHITDRINKAVEQLGAEKTVKVPNADGDKSIERSEPNIEVRIGAILSLERIAQDSTKYDKGRDHVRVMEILCAYIRENAPASIGKVSLRERYEIETEGHGPDDPPLTDEQFLEKYTGSPNRDLDDYISVKATENWARNLPKPRNDIEIALHVIGRRDSRQRLAEARWGQNFSKRDTWVFDETCPRFPMNEEVSNNDVVEIFYGEVKAWADKVSEYNGYRLYLRNTNLQRADLSGLCFAGARFSGARLEGAKMIQTSLEGAQLTECRMYCVNLWKARLDGAHGTNVALDGANLSDASIEAAFFHGLRLEEVHMSSTSFRFSKLRATRFISAHVNAARFEGADLSHSRIYSTYLAHAHFESSNLNWVDFRGSNFLGTFFNKLTNFSKVKFPACYWTEMDLSGVSIDLDDFSSSFGDASVTLPNNVVPTHPDWPAHWPKEKLDWRDFDIAYKSWLSSQP